MNARDYWVESRCRFCHKPCRRTNQEIFNCVVNRLVELTQDYNEESDFNGRNNKLFTNTHYKP